jgi:uncharacterized protein Usg
LKRIKDFKFENKINKKHHAHLNNVSYWSEKKHGPKTSIKYTRIHSIFESAWNAKDSENGI